MSEAVREMLDEEEEELLEEEPTILDDMSAEMALKTIREAQDEYERMEAWYKTKLEQLKEWRDRKVAWAQNGLKGYFSLVPTHDTKTRKTYDLPGATLTMSRQDAKYDVKDEELVPWLKMNQRSDLIRVKEEAEWGKLKKELSFTVKDGKVVTEDGEIIPGVTATERADKFTVTSGGRNFTLEDGKLTVTVKK